MGGAGQQRHQHHETALPESNRHRLQPVVVADRTHRSSRISAAMPTSVPVAPSPIIERGRPVAEQRPVPEVRAGTLRMLGLGGRQQRGARVQIDGG